VNRIGSRFEIDRAIPIEVDLIEPGDIVTTDYGTGPYKVIELAS
jgi:hypothetical protein